MKYEMFTKHGVVLYIVGSWHAAYRLHPRTLPDLRNLAQLGHAHCHIPGTELNHFQIPFFGIIH